MSKCLEEAVLRAYVDLEVQEPEASAVANHVASCAGCADRLQALRASAAEVGSLLESLTTEHAQPVSSPQLAAATRKARAVRFRREALAAVGLLAAGLVVAVALWDRPVVSRDQPAAAGLTAAPQSMPRAAVPTTSQSSPNAEQVVAAVRSSDHPPVVRRFIALDNEPVESGLIYRVNLPGSLVASIEPSMASVEIPAEVIVDGFGRLRAVRFLR